RLDNRLRLAEEFGADATINVEEYTEPAARVQRVRDLTKGRGANIVMELVGKAELLAEGIDMLSNGGSFVEIGDIVRGRYKLPFHTLISHKFPLARVNEACEKAEWNQRQTEITRAVLVP